jgi:hypothetical protein
VCPVTKSLEELMHWAKECRAGKSAKGLVLAFWEDTVDSANRVVAVTLLIAQNSPSQVLILTAVMPK